VSNLLNELEGIHIGPIFLSFYLLALGLSILIAYLTFAYLVRTNEPNSSKILGTLQTSGLIFMIIYKLLPFFLQPSYFFTPSKILIYSGGPWAVQIAALVSISYFSFYFYKEKWSMNIVDFLAISVYAFLIANSLLIKTYGVATPFQYGFVQNGIIYHPINIYYFLLYSLSLLSLYNIFNKQKPGIFAIMLVLAYFLIKTLLSPFT
jgi:hypothetical protein